MNATTQNQSWFENLLSGALETVQQFGTGLLQIDLLRRANTATGNTQQTNNQQQPQETTGQNRPSLAERWGLPEWAIPAGVVALIIIIILILLGGKKS